MIAANDITQNNAPWVPSQVSRDYQDCAATARRWIFESVLPFALLVRKELAVSGDVQGAEANMETIMECAKEHAYAGARHECRGIDDDTFSDAWKATLVQALKQVGA